MSWALFMQSFMLLRLDAQFFHLFSELTQNKIHINNNGIAKWCKFSKYFVFDINFLEKAV